MVGVLWDERERPWIIHGRDDAAVKMGKPYCGKERQQTWSKASDDKAGNQRRGLIWWGIMAGANGHVYNRTVTCRQEHGCRHQHRGSSNSAWIVESLEGKMESGWRRNFVNDVGDDDTAWQSLGDMSNLNLTAYDN